MYFPEVILRAISSTSTSSSKLSFAISTSPARSPMPRRREMNLSASKGSRSLMCSPVPMNTILALVVATAESAPPPRDVPSILVTMTPVTPTALLKASAWGPACCPTCESRTSILSSGSVASAMSVISLIRSSSSAWRPEESMILTFLSLNLSIPSRAILTASFS